MGGGSFVPKQQNWRCCKNDGTPPATFYANENVQTGVLTNNGNILRIRVCIAETGGSNGTLTNFRIQYSTNESSWVDMGVGNHWNWADGLGADGGAVSTRILTDTDTNGIYLESSGNSPSLVKSKLAEYDFAITPTANVSQNTAYFFRFVYSTSTEIALNTGKTHPKITTAVNAVILVISSPTNASGSDNVDVTQKSTLSISDATQTNTAEVLGLSQKHTISISDCSHLHSSENIGLTQSSNLSLNDSSNVLASDNIDLAQKHTLAVSDSINQHSSDNVDLTQKHTIVIGDSSHIHTAGNLSLQVIENLILEIQDTVNSVTSDNISIIQKHTIIIADCTNSHSSENTDLTQKHTLSVGDCVNAQTSDNTALTQKHTIVIASDVLAQISENLILTQKHTITISDGSIVSVSDDLVLVGLGDRLSIDNASLNYASGSPPLVQNLTLSIQDSNVGGTNKKIIISDDGFLIRAGNQYIRI